ncbi:MAG: hypothetical protein WCB21_03220, partial [Azonexus sp.]
FYNLAKFSVRVNDETKLLEIEKRKNPMAYSEAAELATRSASSDSDLFGRRQAFQPAGTAIGEPDELLEK